MRHQNKETNSCNWFLRVAKYFSEHFYYDKLTRHIKLLLFALKIDSTPRVTPFTGPKRVPRGMLAVHHTPGSCGEKRNSLTRDKYFTGITDTIIFGKDKIKP